MTRKAFIYRGRYRYVHRPDHPHAGKQGYIAEHRVIMEEAIGRNLKWPEVVHHIDGDPENNAVENLQLFSSPGQHTKHAHPEARRNGAASRLGKRPTNYNRGKKECPVCSCIFETTLGSSGKRYCSRKCFADSRVGVKPKNMKGLDLGRGWNKGMPLTWAPKGKDSPNYKHGRYSKYS